MGNKLLTISIAAYNSENYIKKALDTIIASSYIDDLEVFIIDDGGKDATLKIAQEYAKRFPNTFVPIHKENGGYGSTVNYSIRNSTGVFFRLLDGDDWLDIENIDYYISILKNTMDDIDILVMGVYNYFEKNGTLENRIFNWSKWPDGIYDLNDPKFECYFSMWNITVRTESLKRAWIDLPEHMLYTDQLFVYNAIRGSSKVKIDHKPVYTYRIGRDGQSVDVGTRKKHYNDLANVYSLMLNDYAALPTSNSSLDLRMQKVYSQVIRTYLAFKPEKKWYNEILKTEQELKSKSNNIYRKMWWKFKKISLIRLFKYPAYCILSNDKWKQ